MPTPQKPKLGRDVFIADSSYVSGAVTLGDECTIMPLVVIRADIAEIRIGSRVNVQDGTIVHTKHGVPLDIADDVGIGHRAVVHCRSIGANTLIGIGAVVLDDCEIGRHCVIAAGTVLTPNTTIPDGKVVMGIPGKVVRDATERDIEMIDHVVQSYRILGRQHREGQFPNICGNGPNTPLR